MNNKCPKCGQRLKRKKQPIRIVKDGIRVYPDGRERCITDAGWQKRREQLFERANRCCDSSACGYSHFTFLGEMHAHHIVKRSVNRDDRLINLLALCESCHRNYHAGAGK